MREQNRCPDGMGPAQTAQRFSASGDADGEGVVGAVSAAPLTVVAVFGWVGPDGSSAGDAGDDGTVDHE